MLRRQARRVVAPGIHAHRAIRGSAAAIQRLHFFSGGRTHAIALHTLAELLFQHLVEAGGLDRTVAADAIVADFNRTQRDAPAPILKLATIRPEIRPRRDRVSPELCDRPGRCAATALDGDFSRVGHMLSLKIREGFVR